MRFKNKGFGVKPNSMHLNTYKEESHMSTPLKLGIATAITLFILLILIGAYLSFLSEKKVIAKNVYINDIPMEGLTSDKAKKELNKVFSHVFTEPGMFKIGDTSFELLGSAFDHDLDIDKAIGEAVEFSKDFSGPFQQNAKRKDFSIDQTYSPEKLDFVVSEILELVPKTEVQDLVKIENSNLVIYKGDAPVKITPEEVKDIILDKFEGKNLKSETIIPLTTGKKDNIDLDKIYSEIRKEPQDAYFDEENARIVPEVNGIDFAVSLDEAKEIYLNEEKICNIPLKIIYPEQTAKKFEATLFKDTIASYSVNLDSKDVNYVNNLEKAIQMINGKILPKGSNFSFLNIINNASEREGFKKIANDEYDQNLPLSNIATGIYVSAHKANLSISERHPNKYLPSFAEAGLDSSIIPNSKDLKFRNNTSVPIKILIQINNNKINVFFQSQKQRNYPEIKLTTIVDKEKIETERKPVFDKEEGYTNILQKGSPKTSAKVYKEIFSNGSSLSKKQLYEDIYTGRKEIIEYGNRLHSNTADS